MQTIGRGVARGWGSHRPEYYKLMDELEEVDPKSSEAKEFMSILSELDKGCTK